MRACFYALLCASLLHGQDPASPTFRVGTRLVQVDVVVRDSKGSVRGLTKSDFTLFDNGKPQAIAVFAMRVESETKAPPVLQPGVVANQPMRSGTEPVSATVILFDAMNTDVDDQAYARLQALKYLEHASRNEQIAVFSLNKTLKVIQSFTSDRDAVVRAIRKTSAETSVDLMAGDLVTDLPVTGDAITDGLTRNAAKMMQTNARERRESTTSAAFATIARHLKGVPGRKKLIWISSSLPLSFQETQEHNLTTTLEYENYSEKVDLPGRMLMDANVALYAIDPRGAKAGLMDDNYGAMNRLASLTGGKAVYASNDVAGALGEFLEDTDVTYTLGYYPPEDKEDGALHSLRVKVDKPGLEVRYRRGYSGEAAAKLTEKQLGSTLTAWAEEPLDATGIAINALAVPAKPGFNKVSIGIDLSSVDMEQANGRWKGRLEVAILTGKDKKTQGLHQTIRLNFTAERLQEVMKTGLIVTNVVAVTRPDGKLLADNLHVVVMDSTTGKAGSVRVPVAR
jgi:VWFA-related protein